jgi:hypothetical protein
MPDRNDEKRGPGEAVAPPDQQTGEGGEDSSRNPAARGRTPALPGTKTSINTDIYRDRNRALPA